MVNKILLIDGMHLCYRNHFVHPHLTNSEGQMTGTIYGVLNCIRSYKRRYKDYSIIFAWDNIPTIRKKMDSQYKADRNDRPDWYFDFLKEIEQVKKVITLLEIDQYNAKGYEADDIAYHIVNKYKNKITLMNHSECILITGDSDWLQLIHNKYNVKVYNPRNDILYDEDKFSSEYNLRYPIMIIMFKILKGDKSDNIFGIKRFPTKLAKYIANKYLNIYILFSQGLKDKKIPDKWRDEIIKNKERLLLNDKLIRFRKIRAPIRKVIGKYDKEKLLKYYKEFEFIKMIRELNNIGWVINE